jgi:crotonobetainyl-CoA:carnitine CoA-transferase CaiB-like acyl-CoA transferase
MAKPLSDIRVLDMSRIFAGPWCGQMLADLGAEVIKVERPQVGDDTRTWAPPFVPAAAGGMSRETGYFLAVNRGKKSVTVDLDSPAGQEVVRKLAAHCDVVLENFRPGTLTRYGLGWEDLRKVNPRLVYCSITGFGQDGPYSNRPAYDFIIQAMGGLMSVTGEREERPGGGPQKVGVPIIDMVTGLYATIAVQAALAARRQSGEGQHIDIGMLDVSAGILSNQAQNFFLSGKVPRCAGNDHPNIVPQRVFRCRDGRLAMVVGNDGQFARFCEVIGKSWMVTDSRFSTNEQRVHNRQAMDAEIDPVLLSRDTAHWVERFNAAGVPCGPIYDMAQLFEDPHLKFRGMRFDMDHPVCGSIPQVANPIRFKGTPVTYEEPPPTLGQHTDSVLQGLLGLSPEQVQTLRREGAV